jgi:hypothetical protein
VTGVVLALAACARARGGWYLPPEPRAPHSPPPPEVAAEDDRVPTRAEMRNVRYHAAPGVAMHLRRLSGRVARTDPARPPFFDDVRSLRFEVDYAEASLGMADLGRLVNDLVLGYPESPLQDVRFSPAGARLRVNATMLRPVNTPIEMTVDLFATEGDLAMRPVDLEAAGLEMKGPFDTLGIRLDEVLDLKGARGARLRGNDMILDPEAVLPPPAVRGEVTDARMEGDRVVLVFGTPGAALPPVEMPRPNASGYMFFRGGTMRFGRLFMVRADLQMVDADPSDAFDFDVRRYEKQLIAGHSRNQPDGGLLVVVPDLDDAERSAPR